MSSEEKVVSIEDDMEDDFDDLLDKFNHAPETQLNEHTQSIPIDNSSTDTKPITTDGTTDFLSPELADEFARDLAEGMEALLAGMKQEDGREFKKHLDALVSGSDSLSGATGLMDALRHTEPSGSNNPKPSSAPIDSEKSNATNSSEPKNFQEAIKETMEKLKQSDDSAKAKNGPSGAEDGDEELSALFEKMMAGESGLPDENQLQTILQSFMEEMMSKEVMYEPLKDMNNLFPKWFEENRTKLSTEELQRYQTQAKIIEEVVQKFEDPSWDSDEKIGGDQFINRQKEVIDLLTQMQDCGPPPKEILGSMPAGDGL